MANFKGMDFKSSGVSQAKKQSGLNEYANSLFDPSLTWKDVKWLRGVTKLPIVLKGILTGEKPYIISPFSRANLLYKNIFNMTQNVLKIYFRYINVLVK